MSPDRETIERLVAALGDQSQATPLVALGDRRHEKPLNRPGLYSLWADENAQQQLIDEKVVPSSWQLAADELQLVYVGQAGAASASKGSRATLWSRISLHISGDIEWSTVRKTVAAILHVKNERAISDWIAAHLHVVVVPYDDRNTLEDTEKAVLRKLDPPLNRKDVPETSYRRRLSDLRSELKKYS